MLITVISDLWIYPEITTVDNNPHFTIILHSGAWRSGLARMVWDHEGVGSNPTAPNIGNRIQDLGNRCKIITGNRDCEYQRYIE
jgi:hypothetical protein